MSLYTHHKVSPLTSLDGVLRSRLLLRVVGFHGTDVIPHCGLYIAIAVQLDSRLVRRFLVINRECRRQSRQNLTLLHSIPSFAMRTYVEVQVLTHARSLRIAVRLIPTAVAAEVTLLSKSSGLPPSARAHDGTAIKIAAD